jgi:hypothetical protein
MRLRLLLVVCLTASIVAGGCGRKLDAAEPLKGGRLRVDFNAKGISALNFGTTSLLADGSFFVERAVFRKADGSESIPPLKPDVRWDARNRILTTRFSWGSVTCKYGVESDRLTFRISVTNDSADTLQGLWLRPLLVRFPEIPRGWHPQGHAPNLSFLPGSPRVHVADFGTGTLAFTNDDITRPLSAGFLWTSEPTAHAYPLIVRSSNVGWLEQFATPRTNRPVPPGGRDEYTLSLRFGPSGSTAVRLADDLFKKFVAAHPYRLQWSDRRPIGALYLSTSDPQHHSQTNPRGWLLDPKGVDVTTPAGRVAFKQRMLQYADGSVAFLKKMGAQGSIVWDLEGQEFPHATSYLGDPRSLPEEMDAIADEFFARLRSDGLRAGVTIRPQLPVRPAYGGKVTQIDVTDPAQNLIDKIEYAKKRWSCSLFYIDSNGGAAVPMEEDVIRRVAAAHPDVLIIPEHQTAAYYAWTAPYHTIEQGIASTPQEVRDAYPSAFSVIYVPQDAAKRRADLVASVRRGDILLFVGWYETPDAVEVRKIYDEAGRRQ